MQGELNWLHLKGRREMFRVRCWRRKSLMNKKKKETKIKTTDQEVND